MATAALEKPIDIPQKVDTNEVLEYLQKSKRESKKLFNALKAVSNMSDDVISDILDISTKTFRNYKSAKRTLSWRLAEHVIALYALFNHGIKVFGSEEEFTRWLNQENFYFGGKPPSSYLQVINGIKFLDDRLTAMEYGDNV